jgi:hypothetical protein
MGRGLLGLLILGCSSGFAEPPIAGTVHGAKGEGLEGVSVTLHIRSSGPRITLTDSTGAYRFEGLGTGSYELTFEREGFTTVTRDVQLTYDDDSGEVNVTLISESASQTHGPWLVRVWRRFTGLFRSAPPS